MSQRMDIIEELEDEIAERLDENFDAGVNELCDGENCRHGSECGCHDSFRACVREALEKQRDEYLATMESMRSLHSAEIHYGLHTPSHLEVVEDEL